MIRVGERAMTCLASRALDVVFSGTGVEIQIDRQTRQGVRERQNETDASFGIRHWMGPNDTHNARTQE